MSQFFISCKESRIESRRSFYSSFFLGPFDPSESLTVANALRRTLLSELPGIAIISVEIEGASHEYSNISGVRDSVLDILLNIKEIVLKKLSKNMRPQVGYLRVRGPGIVRASDLRLPPLIQCVDPEQYIATLSEDGFLNMKFIIDEGKNYIKVNPKTVIDLNQFKKRRLILKKLNKLVCDNSSILNNFYNYLNKKNKITFENKYLVRSKAFFKQEQHFLCKLKKVYIKKLEKKKNTLSTYLQKKEAYKQKHVENFNLLNVDAVFNPINKVNYIIEVNEHKIVENAFEKSNIMEDTSKILNSSFHPSFARKGKETTAFFYQDNLARKVNIEKSKPLLSTSTLRCLENLLNYQINLANFKNLPYKKQISDFQNYSEFNNKNKSSLEKLLITNQVKSYRNSKVNETWVRSNLENIDEIMDLKNQTTSEKLQINDFQNDLIIPGNILTAKKDILKHNIIIEIWTNGSLHPREAMYQAFKHLIKLFSKLKKIKILNQIFKSDKNYTNLIRKVKNENFDLFPLNENLFLGKYAGIKKFINLTKQTNNGCYKHTKRNIIKKKNQIKDYLMLNNQQNILKAGFISPKNSQNKDLITNNSQVTNNKKLLNLDNINSSMDIGELNISLRPYTCLKRSNINTVSELLKKSKKDLLKLSNLGKKSVEEIEKSLAQKGLFLLT
jgi:DNA-directed RNA polymerase alpha subunit